MAPRKRMRKIRKRGKKFATVAYVNKKIHSSAETKYHDTLVNGDVDSVGTLFQQLTTITQNITDVTRIGDKITLRGLEMRGYVRIDTTALGDAYNIIRVIIFQWHPTAVSIGAPSAAVILNYIGGTLAQIPVSPYTHDYQDQFTILYDKFMDVSGSDNVRCLRTKKINLKYAKKTLGFIAASSNASNHIYCLLVSDSSATPHPVATLQFRVYFDDS